MSAVRVRPLVPSDQHAIRYGLDHLSVRSRYQRFLALTPVLSVRELERLVTVDHWHHEALIAWSISPRRPLGVARYVRAEDFELAEIAVAVIDDWQQRGVGTTLLAELARAARTAGIRRFAATALAENRGAWRLAERVGPVTVRRHFGGIVEIFVDAY